MCIGHDLKIMRQMKHYKCKMFGKYAKKMAKIQEYLNYTEISRQVLRFLRVDAGAWLGGSAVEMMSLSTGQ